MKTKTVLTIDGSSFLVPDNVEASKMFELLRGLKPCRSDSSYRETPGDRYGDYVSKWVVTPEVAKIKVEVAPETDFCTTEEWAEIKAKHAAPKQASSFPA